VRIHCGLGDSVSIKKPNILTRLILSSQDLFAEQGGVHIRSGHSVVLGKPLFVEEARGSIRLVERNLNACQVAVGVDEIEHLVPRLGVDVQTFEHRLIARMALDLFDDRCGQRSA